MEWKKIITISHEQAIKLLSKRMDRQLEKHAKSIHFVPLYDYNGDVIWPANINHEDINVD